MTVAQSADFLAAASVGRRNFLDTGSGNAQVLVFATTRPAAGVDPASSPLVTITLAKPCGTVLAGGALQLEQEEAEGDLIQVSGTAVWARFINGAGTWAFDVDVSAAGGAGEVQFPTTTLYAGGRAPLSTSTIG